MSIRGYHLQFGHGNGWEPTMGPRCEKPSQNAAPSARHTFRAGNELHRFCLDDRWQPARAN
ncbi:MAG: hypothetical protein WB424_04155 [Terracidiphilus sp.]